MKIVKKLNKIIFGIIVLSVIMPFFVLVISTKAQTVTQGYGSDMPVEQGMIVGLSPKDLTKVEPINTSQSNQIRGVVISANDSVIALSSSQNQIYVANSGRFMVLVSNQNGNINAGDYVTVSALDGIGMKANSADSMVIGKALDSFNSNDNNQIIGTANVKNTANQNQQLQLGQVLVDINIAKNPLLQTNNTLPGILKNVSQSLAGKPVSPVRIYLSLVIIAIVSTISGSLIYSGVRSGLIAIGRNPLSRKLILRSLIQVVLISLMVFLSGLFGVYLLLKV